MNFQHLVTFNMVLNEKSMTAAAQKLFLTQPAVSQQIRQLEDYMGIDLLVRGVRRVQPTPQGMLLYDYAQRIIRLVKEAEVAIQTMGGEVSGPLRVATLNSIGLHLMGPIFAMFLKNNKNVRLELSYDQGKSLIQKIEKGDLDIILIPDAAQEYGEDPKDCDKYELVQDEMWLVCSSQEDAPTSISLQEFANHTFVSLVGEYVGFENVLSKALKKEGVKLNTVFATSNVGTIKRVIEAGLGWGFVPSHSIKKQVKDGRLKHIPVVDFSYEYKLVCYVNRTKAQLKSAQVFMKALEQQI